MIRFFRRSYFKQLGMVASSGRRSRFDGCVRERDAAKWLSWRSDASGSISRPYVRHRFGRYRGSESGGDHIDRARWENLLVNKVPIEGGVSEFFDPWFQSGIAGRQDNFFCDLSFHPFAFRFLEHGKLEKLKA